MKHHIIIAAIAVTGCGRDASTSSKETPSAGAGAGTKTGLTKACDLMTRADAETAAGIPLPKTQEDIPKHEWEVATCSYVSPDFFAVELVYRDWEGLTEGMKIDAAKKPLSVVTGIGDEAWGVDAGIQYTRLYVKKGDRGIALTLNSPPIRELPDKGLARAKVLAQKIVPLI